MGWCHWIFLFSRTAILSQIAQIYTWKLPDIVQIHACTNYGSRGSGGATRGDQFLHEYNGKNALKLNRWPIQSNFVQAILAGREFKFIQMKGLVLFKGVWSQKCKNRVASFTYFFSHEPQYLKMIASWHSVESILFNHGPWRINESLKIFSRIHWPPKKV
jgi:hypothetical protein